MSTGCFCVKSRWVELGFCAVSTAAAPARPVQEAKSKSTKAAVQSAPVSVTKPVVISAFQHAFAYLARAAVRKQSNSLLLIYADFMLTWASYLCVIFSVLC